MEEKVMTEEVIKPGERNYQRCQDNFGSGGANPTRGDGVSPPGEALHKLPPRVVVNQSGHA